MGVPRAARRLRAPRRVRARGRAGRGGLGDPGAVPVAPSVVLVHATGCHLCEEARAELLRLGEELGFPLDEVAIDGDPDLERRYRERIPVVELDGREIASFHVFAGPFRRAWTDAQSGTEDGSS